MGAFPGRGAAIELAAIYEISKILSSSLDLNKTARGVLGVLSALPIVNIGNACCCLWVIAGGVAAAYLLQNNRHLALRLITCHVQELEYRRWFLASELQKEFAK